MYAADRPKRFGKLDDDAGAEHWSCISEEHGESDDVSAQFAWRAARAPVLNLSCESRKPERLPRQAVELGAPTGRPQQAPRRARSHSPRRLTQRPTK